MGQICGHCKVEKEPEEFSPSYRGKSGTWCRACFSSYMRGERGTTGAHQPRTCVNCGEQYIPRQLKARAMYCSRQCGGEYRKHSGQTREAHLRRKYGITQADYERLLELQGGGCALCSIKPGVRGKYRSYLHVDHDHTTGAVRGLLCDQCNLLLGQFGDDVERLYAAVKYLRRPPARLLR